MASSGEPKSQFESRKQDHIKLSLDGRSQSPVSAGFEDIELIHDALPEVNFSEVSLRQSVLGLDRPTPFLVSSMTAGHVGAVDLNVRLAEACERRGWMMGVGSQRRELSDPGQAEEWKSVRKRAPRAILLGNLGLTQLIRTSDSDVLRLCEGLEASAMIIHCNALQEALQPEGTPEFKGGLERLSRLCEALSIPVILKETGSGFSKTTLAKMKNLGLSALDVSGLGGTHWGLIEGLRAHTDKVRADASLSFAGWGVRTVDSLKLALDMALPLEVWASGGVRSGVDAAIALAMGANVVGLAQPILAKALEGAEALDQAMQVCEFELKTAIFCTGCANLAELREKKVWQWKVKERKS